MKRFTVLALGLAFMVTALAVHADQGHGMSGMKMGAEKKAAAQSISGEVVDTGCYLGHAARGEKHIECATKCINNGMPMGILTSTGKLYLVLLNHDNADPYNSLKGMAGKNVTVTGTVSERSGMKGIDVTDVKPAAAPAAAPASK